MRRRAFCTNAISASVVAALPVTAKLALANATSPVPAEVLAVSGKGEEVALEGAAVRELRDSLDGLLLLRGDQGYELARQVWNGMVDKRPSLIVQCQNTQDVVNAVTFAADRGLLLSVKGGGHSYPGKCVADNGLMIDLGAMQQVTVDAANKTATAQGGALLGHLDSAALPHNLITTTGVVSHTGVGGFTLGGGMGRTDRVTGLAVDNVLGATLVTADGSVRELNHENETELFWGIRGGGGNFGITTQFEFQLHPFNPEIYGGSIFYPVSELRTVLENWAEVNDSLPDGASVEPQLYPISSDEQVLELQLYFTGDHAEGERVFAEFAKVGKPNGVDLGLKKYAQVQTMWDQGTAHGQLNYIKSGLLPALTQGAIDAIVESYQGEFLPGTWFQHLGGASARIDPQATAFPHRKVQSNYGITSTWTDPSESEVRIAKIREIYSAVQPYMKGFYTNLNEDGLTRTERNYGVNYDRLLSIKDHYDPTNLFRLNANIVPTEKMS